MIGSIRPPLVHLLFGVVFAFSAASSQSQSLPADDPKAWFGEARYGIFLHWLLPDFPEEDTLVRLHDYPRFRKAGLKVASQFHPKAYDPKAWAKELKALGARYVVLTSKHHLGFALYDAPGSPFSVARHSPVKKDLIRPYVEAIRAEGLKVGLYFSLPDRMHPDYESLRYGPDKKVDEARSDRKAWERFRNQMHREVAWLCTQYGTIDLFWFDGDWERSAEDWNSPGIRDTVVKYQPRAVLNNRLRHKDIGDYATPEMKVPLRKPGGTFRWWELCTTLGYNWCGPDGSRFLKSPDELLRIFSHVNTLGGNLLLNLAPDDNGRLPEDQLQPVRTFSAWVQQNGEAIFGAAPGLPPGYFHGGSTQKNGVLYLWVQDYPEGELVLKGVEGKIKSVQILHNGRQLAHRGMRDYHEDKGRRGWRFITLPKEERHPPGLVLKVEFEEGKFSVSETW